MNSLDVKQLSRRAYPWIDELRINHKTANLFGVSASRPPGTTGVRVTVPIRDFNGGIIASAARITSDSRAVWHYSSDFDPASTLFNIESLRHTRTTILVRDIMECLRIKAAGLQSVALMGISVSSAQSDLLARACDKVIFVHDHGDTSEQELQIAARLARKSFVRIVSLPKGTLGNAPLSTLAGMLVFI